MTVSAVSARYVDALFAVSHRHNQLEAVRQDVERLAREFDSPNVRRVLLDPRRSSQERVALLEPVLAPSTPLFQKFVKLLYSKRRESVLVELGEAFRAKLLKEAGAVEGVVESARPLAGAEIERLAGALEQRLSKRVHLENTVDPGLIGGFRVRVGSQMLDQTLKGRMERLRSQLLSASLTAPVAPLN